MQQFAIRLYIKVPFQFACSNVKWTNLTQSSSNFQPLRQLFCQNGDELCPPTYTRTSMIEFKLHFCIQTQSFDWRKILIFIFFFILFSSLFAVHFIAHWLDTIFMNRLFAIRLETDNKCMSNNKNNKNNNEQIKGISNTKKNVEKNTWVAYDTKYTDTMNPPKS